MRGVIIHLLGRGFVPVILAVALAPDNGQAAPATRVASGPEPVTVSFSKPGGVYTSNLVVSLSAPAPGANLRYSLDGSDPTPQSPAYSGPLQITNSVVVKAKAFIAGKAAAIGCQTFTLVDPSLAEFSSNLPLVILNAFGREIDTDQKSEVSVRIIGAGQGRATITGAPDLDSRALINLRGHTSLRYPKRSFQLKLRDADGSPLKASVLGMPKDSDWVLYAPYSDKTLLRDVLAYELSNQMGRYAPRTRFVEVFLNSAGGKLALRQYLGVFILEEKIKRAKERVRIEKLGPEDNAEPAISGGYIFKKDHLDRVEVGTPNTGGFPNGGGAPSMERDGYPTGPGGFPGDPRGFLPTRGQADTSSGLFSNGRDQFLNGGRGFMTPKGSQFLFVEPKADEITPAQRRWLSQHLRKAETALYGPEFRDPKRGYAAYLDADSFIDHHLLVEATKNIDGFRFSTFFHKDRGGLIEMGPIWDWNLSFGAANGKQGFMAQNWYWPQLDDQQYSWFRRLFGDPDFAQRYVDRWGALRTNQFRPARILARVDELANVLNEAQARNFKRWRILGRQVWPQFYTGKTYGDEVEYLKTWIDQRLAWIDRQFVPGPTLALDPTSSGVKLSMRSASGKVYYTLDGSDPRASGGAVAPGARLYESPIRLDANPKVMARVLSGKRWSWPSKAGEAKRQ